MNHIKMLMETQERNSLWVMSNPEKEKLYLCYYLECQNVTCRLHVMLSQGQVLDE